MVRKKVQTAIISLFLVAFVIIFIRVVVLTTIYDQKTAPPPADKKNYFNTTVEQLIRQPIDNEKTFDEKSIKRAEIEDRNGHTLAYSLLRYNIYYNGRKDLTINQTSKRRIAKLLNIDIGLIEEAIEEKKVVLLSRYANKEIFQKIYALRLPTLLTEKVLAREYPEGSLMAQTLGFMGYNGVGLTGIENSYQPVLRIDDKEAWQSGDLKLRLTIDRDLQYTIERRLRAALRKHQAKFVTAIVEDVNNGEILAMATAPSFNLNNFTQTDQRLFYNPATSQLLEPGSVFKAFSLGKLLNDHTEQDWDQFLSEKRYFCPGYYVTKNGETIQCTGIHNDVSLYDIIRLSCNAGMMQAMESYSINELHSYFTSLKIGRKTGIDLPGESWGILPPSNKWGSRTKATITIGQGVAITPIQLINSFSTLINGGNQTTPHLAKELRYYQTGVLIKKKEVAKKITPNIINEKVSKALVDALVYGTTRDSTGQASRKTGLNKVFGKTGTSQKVNLIEGGYYTNRYDSIFAGGYPKEDPQYAVLVLLSEPKKQYQGGLAAAPLFAEIVDDIVRTRSINKERKIETIENKKINQPRSDEIISQILNGLQINQYTRVPDFHSLSLRQVLLLLEEIKNGRKALGKPFDYRLLGSGYVIKQSPPAGELFKDDETLIIYLNK